MANFGRTRSALNLFLRQCAARDLDATIKPCIPVTVPSRAIKRYVKPYLMELKRKQQKYPTPVLPQSAFIQWNRKAELYAFGKRLSESFDENELDVAFTHISYIREQRMKESAAGLEIQDQAIERPHNLSYINSGHEVMSSYIMAFLRYSLPYLPEEGISSIHDYLMSQDVLVYISSNLGLSDLILCNEFPVGNGILVDCFKAIIGLIYKSKDLKRVENFVRDFVITHLNGKDINEYWQIQNPTIILKNIMLRNGMSEAEPRLLRECGKNTMYAVYVIGLYVDKSLLAVGSGETLTNAEEMASREALKNFFRTTDSRTPLPFSGHPNLDYNKKNIGVHKWSTELADENAIDKLPQAVSN